MMDSGSKSIRAGLNLLNSTSTSTFHHHPQYQQYTLHHQTSVQAPPQHQQLASTAANTNGNSTGSSRVTATTTTTHHPNYQQHQYHPPLLHHNSIGLVTATGTGAGTGTGKAAALIKQSSTIGLRVNPKSPMRLNAMRERERRHLDSLNYWKREFAPLPVAEHGACKKAACNPSIDAYVPPKTRSASRNKVMPAPFPTSNTATATIVVTHGGVAGGKQSAVPTTNTNSVISGKAVGGGGGVPEAVSRRYAEFAKKLSPIQNSPQFFNHQLALENQPRALSPLKSPPTSARGLAAHNQTLLGYHHHPMDLRSHRHSNFSHHKSAVYAMTATTAHHNQQQMPPPSYYHPVGGTGSVAGAPFGAAEMGMGCHQAAMAAGHWNAAMGAPHYNGYYHNQPQVVVSRGYGGGGGADADCEEGCENTHPPDLVAVDGTGTKPAVEEDEELIFAIEI